MNRIKHRFSFGAMTGGILLAVCMTPAQAVLAATPSSDTPPTTTTTAPQTTTTNAPDNGQGQSTPSTSGSTTAGQGTSPENAPYTSPDPTTNAPAASDSATTPANPTNQTGTSNPNSTSTQANDNGQAVNTTTISTAQSGDVSAQGNLSSVGNATSGTASSTDTQVTTLNSSTTLDNPGGLQTFTFNINGNHVGNILLSPAAFLQSSAATATQSPENASVTNQTNSTITNTIDLSAQSGNVSVEGNLGTVGNATSGSATTELNLINMIESTVSDKQAFVGMVNINGNLKGNLLLPKSAIDSLLPSQPNASTSTSATSTTTTDNNLNVNNNVTLNAQSGNVSVEGNGSAGNATSGSAATGLKLYNLTNSQIVGGNVLLVFVNVEGSWVGMLMNAPAGTTSAALGGGITKDTSTAASSNTTTSTTETINNNVNLSSNSGNVAAKGNGKVGNSTSGNASANADVVNILGSQVDLSGWLGVLVINVNGSWNGSLEIQPAQVTIHVKAPPTHHMTTHSATTTTANYTGNTASQPQTLQTNHLALTAAHILGDTTGSGNALDANKHVASAITNNLGGKHSSADILLASIGGTLAVIGGATQFLRRKRHGSSSTPTVTRAGR
ncbi:MAG TPA: hypothetical protein VGG13_03355 [Candidatus Saccharimonadales bacterium]|jgi:hypothetical protein